MQRTIMTGKSVLSNFIWRLAERSGAHTREGGKLCPDGRADCGRPRSGAQCAGPLDT